MILMAYNAPTRHTWIPLTTSGTCKSQISDEYRRQMVDVGFKFNLMKLPYL